MNLSNHILITHKNCMDGAACALLFQLAGGHKKNIFYCNPDHESTDEVVSGFMYQVDESLLIVDLSISTNLAKKINESQDLKEHIVILDHHKSAIPLADFPFCKIDVGNHGCGSMMFYDWIKKNCSDMHQSIVMRYKDLVDRVDDYDRWVHQYPESKLLADLHTFLGQDEFVIRFLNFSSISLTGTEKYALNLLSQKKEKFIQDKKRDVVVKNILVNGKEYKIGFVLADQHQSELGNVIVEDGIIGVDAAALIGTNSISLRGSSSSSIDLSELAKKFGGGGHRLAAGCKLNNVIGQDLVDMVIKGMTK